MNDGTLFAGIDLGSTNLKMLVVRPSGEEVVSAQEQTPWHIGRDGATEIHASNLLASLRSLLRRAQDSVGRAGGGRVAAIAVSGMGETGLLRAPNGAVDLPGFAWFDPRGSEEAADFPSHIRREFPGRTGLPLGAQVTVAKLAWLQAQGIELSGLQFLSLPEFAVAALGGDVAAELSLASRTGLIDQSRSEVWPEMLTALGLEPSILPSLREAGSCWGRARGALAGGFEGARLTVAGHDHLVAAEASGELTPDRYYVSMGTAEVLLRVMDQPLGYEARSRLAGNLINEVRHVSAGKHALVAGLKSGLLLRRALQIVGVEDRAGRQALDAEVMALPYEGGLPEGALQVSGGRNDDGVLAVRAASDGLSPAELFRAVLRHCNDEIRILVEAMDREITPATSTVLTGGWTGMESVLRAHTHVLPDVTVSSREEETAFGATVIARRLLANCTETTPV